MSSNPAPEPAKPLTRWQRARLVIKVIEVRVRFIAILVATGLFIGYWDTIQNHWDKWTRPAGAAVTAVAADSEFYCPMHPSVVRAGLEPNGSVPRCPICGMPLSLRKKGQAAPLPEGVTARVQLAPERVRLAGIGTEEIVRRPLAPELVTVGYVAYDETRLSRIVSRVGGYVERLFIDQNFARVEQGTPLAEVYSPELYASARELAVALKAGSAEIVAGARERLRLLGLADAEIDEIARTGTPRSTLLIRAPRGGHVIVKDIVAGARIEAGMRLFEVANLASVWIEAAVYEKDLPLVAAGARVEATVESRPNLVFAGRIALVYPEVDPKTRTIATRIVLENPDGALRPGMFATVRIRAPGGEALAVPERAVIDTGSRKVVYVERAPGVFDGVLVKLGPRVGAYYPVIEGLAEGERVASAGSFLVDAETRLNPAAGAAYAGAAGGPRADRPQASTAGGGAKDPAVADAAAPRCPISGEVLGSMGPPFEVSLGERKVTLCCPGCEKDARADPAKVFRALDASGTAAPAERRP